MRRGHFDFGKPQKFFSLSLLTCASPSLMVQSQGQWVRQKERGGQGREHWWPRMGGWGPEWGELSICAGRGAGPARFQPKQGKEGVAVDGRVSRGVWAEHEGVPQEGGVWGDWLLHPFWSWRVERGLRLHRAYSQGNYRHRIWLSRRKEAWVSLRGPPKLSEAVPQSRFFTARDMLALHTRNRVWGIWVSG